MKNIFLIAISSLLMCSCGYEIVKKKPAPKPKLTKEQIRKQQHEEKLREYDVRFLFECNGVKVYRFYDCDKMKTVYFTNANGNTSYKYTTMSGKTSVSHEIQSINIKK
jgi:hypothetical protein|uniref:DUF4884 domain-containing protein n=1 Tax=Podoviridae sp. ctDwO1 TaxID=2827726 RepID=A0A8S5TA52_9CAUD|nr:MAG TPA: protein of unknown function (DUF4884) [Podoviridae sp. ctDwO1]